MRVAGENPATRRIRDDCVPRSGCDLVRSRNKMDGETFLAGLPLYAVRPDKDLDRLDAYARRFRASCAVARFLEVLL